MTKKSVTKKSIRFATVFSTTYVKKSKAAQLTGEWIVYLPYRRKNYYLCLGTHNDIQSIYYMVTRACPVEPGFKDILKWWEEVRANPIIEMKEIVPKAIVEDCKKLASLSVSEGVTTAIFQVQAKMHVPANKYSEDIFKVKKMR